MDSKAIMFSSFLKNCMIFLNEKKSTTWTFW